ncbi:hypothetical protein PVAP13_5KG044200 [Panicum virgatum]|uniref:Uncharacterized protein n=1 Tax=Panicum virgatum TaxID=38727 RepID=A0A8T0SA13_PANVG|nr:hypothetical protein PVAP13_5KG044200 [Panicum virgatum]
MDVQASMQRAYHGGRPGPTPPEPNQQGLPPPPGLSGERERATSPPGLHSTVSTPAAHLRLPPPPRRVRAPPFPRPSLPCPRACDNIFPAAASTGTQAASPPHLPTARVPDADSIAIVGVRPTKPRRWPPLPLWASSAPAPS